MIEEKDLVVRHIYRVHARNLEGPSVYAGNGVFYGIREKFGSRFTEAEYLNVERMRPHNTCTPLEDLGPMPDEIEIRPHDPTVDRATNREVFFDKPIRDGGKGWCFKDTGEPSEEIRPIGQQNETFYKYLESLVEQSNNKGE
jgi:hypothetical protein